MQQRSDDVTRALPRPRGAPSCVDVGKSMPASTRMRAPFSSSTTTSSPRALSPSVESASRSTTATRATASWPIDGRSRAMPPPSTHRPSYTQSRGPAAAHAQFPVAKARARLELLPQPGDERPGCRIGCARERFHPLWRPCDAEALHRRRGRENATLLIGVEQQRPQRGIQSRHRRDGRPEMK